MSRSHCRRWFSDERAADLSGESGCGYQNAVELTQSVHAYSAPVMARCASAAALVMWERDVVRPAARRRYGQDVARIELAAPSYQCRRIAGRRDRRLSEHAHANAMDIKGFTLADGRTVTVADGWRGAQRDRLFLHDVRDGACTYFQAVLSPDYNRDHRDHLHFDLGRDHMCR
ncbi:MAG: extensin family protein [Hyphomonadaceae bacterium]|nr:extensin family protein [Hyphomonadaceae bacterium]